MTGEQHEGPAAGGIDQRHGGVDDRRHVIRRLRLGQALRQIQQALALVVERAVDLQRLRISEAEPAGEVR